MHIHDTTAATPPSAHADTAIAFDTALNGPGDGVVYIVKCSDIRGGLEHTLQTISDKTGYSVPAIRAANKDFVGVHTLHPCDQIFLETGEAQPAQPARDGRPTRGAGFKGDEWKMNFAPYLQLLPPAEGVTPHKQGQTDRASYRLYDHESCECLL